MHLNSAITERPLFHTVPAQHLKSAQMSLRDKMDDKNLVGGLEHTEIRSIAHAKRRRAGKKAQITKKINEIRQLVDQRGSRTKLHCLKEILISALL